MRKAHRENPLVPYFAAVLGGYGVSLALAVVFALLLWLMDGAVAGSGAAAVLIMAVGSFISGRIGGVLKKVGGLRVGMICGVMYFLPLLLLSLGFGVCSGIMLIVKAALCLAFSAAGGVAGVNSRQ